VETKPYKAMLTLNGEERRGLNTFAAIRSLTPNRYVEAAVRAQLKADAATTGLSIDFGSEGGPIPGQLAIEHEAPGKARRASTRPRAAKKESGR
jgi:hypothetical protein